MRLPDWNEDQISKTAEVWAQIGDSSGSSVYESLAKLLSTDKLIPASLLQKLDGSDNRSRSYRKVQIRKRRGGTRDIDIPSPLLMSVQRRLLQVFTHIFPRHKCACGFERSKGIVTHARYHLKKEWVYAIDIKDFFPSINWGRICGMMQSYPFCTTAEIARLIANLTTFEGRLPQGAPTSPVLANLLCRKLDSRLFKWARQNGYQYSRYADDLAFSTNKGSISIGDRGFIDQIVESEGFTVHPDKKLLMPRWGRQIVTGLIVNEKLNVPKEYTRNLRALLYNIKAFGWESQIGRQSVPLHDFEIYQDPASEQRERNRLVDHQSAAYLLIRPSAQLHGIESWHDMARMLNGRIAFLRQVKGFEDTVVVNLQAELDGLVEKDPLRNESTKIERLAKEQAFGSLKKQDAKLWKDVSAYRDLKKKIQDAEPSVLEDVLSNELGGAVESELLLRDLKRLETNRLSVISGLRKEVLQLGFAYLVTKPKRTAWCFALFLDRTGFNGLLHDNPSRPTQELITSAQGALDHYKDRIPNSLKVPFYGSVISRKRSPSQFLDACRDRLRNDPDWHPFRDQEFLDSHFKALRQRIRFGNDDNSFDLIGKLESISEDSTETQGPNPRITLGLPVRNLTLYTDTDAVTKGIVGILQSMLQHTDCDNVFVTWETSIEEEKLLSQTIRISDQSEIKAHEPKPVKWMGGDLGNAVRSLRGYAEWKIRARFYCGDKHEAYEIDMMRNIVEPIETADGVEHLLTFYQTSRV